MEQERTMKIKTKDELMELYVKVVNKVITYLQNDCVHMAGTNENIYELYGQKRQLEDILGLKNEEERDVSENKK
tara:strand:- start:1890 stop:2111 length:222 start_codon:yes stop_codon:yes gene_type:complete